MPIMPGWEVSQDRVSKVEWLINKYDVGDLIITSKCKRGGGSGFLIASDKGFAWRIKPTATTGWKDMNNNMWIRWHDLYEVLPKKPGIVLIKVKKRRMKKTDKSLILDKKGNYTFKTWKLSMVRNKDEPKDHYQQRLNAFNDIFKQLWERYRGDGDPEYSDTNY